MKRAITAILVFSLAFMVAGCGIIDKIRGKDDELELLKPNPVPDITQEVALKRDWSFSIGGGGQTGLRPAVSAGAVFIANGGGDVAGVDIESGSTLWRRDAGISVTGGVGVGEGLVLVGGLDGEVVALDQRDGAELWRSTVGSEVLAPPMAGSGVVVVRTIDGKVTGLSSTSGQTRWNLRRDVPSLTLRGEGPPLIDQGVAVMGFADGKLVAIDVESGTLLWEVPVARPSGTNEVERMIDVDAAPLRIGNVLYAVSFQGNMTAYALGVNQTMWTRRISSYADFTVDADNLYVSDSGGRVHALDRSTGDEVWVQEQLLRRSLSGPALIDDYVVVGDFEGYVHIMDKSDGRLVGRHSLGSRVEARPVARNSRILVMTLNGSLRSLSIDAGG